MDLVKTGRLSIDQALAKLRGDEETLTAELHWQDERANFIGRILRGCVYVVDHAQILKILIDQYHVPTSLYPDTRFLQHAFDQWSPEAVLNIKRSVCAFIR
jgi:hypothetical protein